MERITTKQYDKKRLPPAAQSLHKIIYNKSLCEYLQGAFISSYIRYCYITKKGAS